MVKNRCKDCLKNSNAHFVGSFFAKKWLSTHIEREHAGFPNSLHCKHPQNQSNSNVLEEATNDNRTLIVGPFFRVRLMLKILSRIPDRDIF